MADEADSKSVGGNTVWVQVPLPAVNSLNFKEFFAFLNLLHDRLNLYHTADFLTDYPPTEKENNHASFYLAVK